MPAKKRSPVFTVTTPVPTAPSVTLWDNTWSNHIQTGHPEMAGKLPNMQATLSAPSMVCEATNPDYLVFVSSTDVDAKGNPLVVCVSPVDSDGPAVVTAYHGGKKYTDPTKVKKVWP